MKKITLLILLLINSLCFCAGKEKATLVVYYFGATSCGFCNTEDFVNNIKKIRNEFSGVHKEFDVKYVMVCMDREIEKGLKFINKYGYWDEISIGSHYKNELVLNYLDKTNVPGVPHIVVFEDKYENEHVPIIKERRTIVDKVGAEEIKEWINNKYPLK